MSFLDTLKAGITVPTPTDIGDTIPDALTGGQASNPDQSVGIANPDLLVESATFGLVSREQASAAGVPEQTTVEDITNTADSSSDATGRNIKILVAVAAFALLSAGVGQLFTFEIGS